MFSIPQSGISLTADSSEVPGFQQPASAMCTSLHTMFLRLSECKNYSASFGNCCSEQLFLFLFLIFFHRSSNVGFPPEGRGCGYNPGNPWRGKGAAKEVAIFGFFFFNSCALISGCSKAPDFLFLPEIGCDTHPMLPMENQPKHPCK